MSWLKQVCAIGSLSEKKYCIKLEIRYEKICECNSQKQQKLLINSSKRYK